MSASRSEGRKGFSGLPYQTPPKLFDSPLERSEIRINLGQSAVVCATTKTSAISEPYHNPYQLKKDCSLFDWRSIGIHST